MGERDIFIAALERQNAAERSAYLAEACAGDPGLREQIESLLRECEELGDFLESPAPGVAAVEWVEHPLLTPSGYHPVAPQSLVGDYRILRELGRGGMGVVYAAEQVSLGRHVALKVLPAHALLGATRLQRFQREARAAGRLHHTNIVPVYGVGEHNSLHYIVMQFIEGLPLDRVLDELRQQRPGWKGSPRAAEKATTAGFADGKLSTPSLARHLLAGQVVVPARPATVVQAGEAAPGEPETPAAMPSAQTQPPGPVPGPASRSGMSGSGRTYYQRAARMALQVAEALDYAARQGVLHRDIKPANLLLDTAGRVWVTDFGVAKVRDSDDLTHSGELVGTLRYMAPERFQGHFDARSDVYSLGLTLYELLTFQPAYDETDANRLIGRILSEEPPPPRRLNAEIPRDLETIVQKAIAREPRRRYESAGALAEDLGRFLADRPIRARRSTPTEKVWRWCRRNPLVATLSAAVLLLLVVLTAGALIRSAELARTVQSERAKRWEALLDRARAGVASGRQGQRFGSLRALREAAQIRVSPEVRDLALAALVLPDVEVADEWDGWPEGTVDVAFDADFQRYVRLDREGGLTLCRRTGGGEEVMTRLPIHGTPPFAKVWMSPDGQYVAYAYDGRLPDFAGGFRVWRIGGAGPEVVLDEPAGVVLGTGLAFRPDSRQLAACLRDGTGKIYDLATGRQVWRATLGERAMLAFHPSDGRLAAWYGSAIHIIDPAGARPPQTLGSRPGQAVDWIPAWHPAGRRLAAGAADRKLKTWDVQTGAEVWVTRDEHPSGGIALAFNHAGDRLVSTCWDGQTRLWDAATGRLLLTLPFPLGYLGNPQFSRDDALLGYERHGSKLRLYRVALGTEVRELRRYAAEGTGPPHALPDSRTLAAVADGRGQLAFFDLDRGAEIELSPGPPVGLSVPQGITPDGGLLVATGPVALSWPARPDPLREGVLRFGPPELLADCAAENFSVGRGGRVLAIPNWKGASVLDLDRPGRRVMIGPQHDGRRCAVSPDGRWVVTSSHGWDHRSPCVRVWDATSGQPASSLPLEGGTLVPAFSPDGRWLGTYGKFQGFRLWEVGTWREGPRVGDGPFAFSPDGRLLALGDMVGVIRLLDPATGVEVTRLTGREPQRYVPECFTPDGTRLVATGAGSQLLYVWDLLQLRDGLRELGLDQDWLPLRSAPRPGPDAPPRRVEIVGGQLGNLYKLRRAEWARCALAVTVNPFEPAANARLGDLLLDDDRETEARARLSLSLAVRPDHLATRLQRARAAARMGDWAAALADLDVYLAAQPGDPDALRLRAGARQRLGRPGEALADWDAVAGWYGGTVAFHLGRAEAYVALGRTAEAETARRRARDMVRDRADSLNNGAWLLVTGGPGTRDAQQALTLARLAAGARPNNVDILNTLGAVLYRVGRYAEAVTALERSLAADHGEYDAGNLFFLAMSHHRLGNPTRARDCFDRAMAWLRSRQPSQYAFSELADFQAEAEDVLASPPQ
jgi:serine/threonine protein kinase/WD40 repeat protein/Tfp pilus assembly protein PilF